MCVFLVVLLLLCFIVCRCLSVMVCLISPPSSVFCCTGHALPELYVFLTSSSLLYLTTRPCMNADLSSRKAHTSLFMIALFHIPIILHHKVQDVGSIALFRLRAPDNITYNLTDALERSLSAGLSHVSRCELTLMVNYDDVEALLIGCFS